MERDDREAEIENGQRKRKKEGRVAGGGRRAGERERERKKIEGQKVAEKVAEKNA